MKKKVKVGFILISIILALGLTACTLGAQNQDRDNADASTNEPLDTLKDEVDTSGQESKQETDENSGENDIKQIPELVLSGIVRFNDLESGFYELDGYRITGDFDFASYSEKFVIATGNPDESPSIFMVKAVTIRDIIIKDDPEFEPRMKELITEFTTALEAAETADEGKEKTELIINNLEMLQLILTKNIMVETGIYNGQADNNVIEIELDNVPKEEATKTFQLSDEIRENFASYDLRKGDSIEIKYQERENQNPIILKIQKR